MNKTAALTVLVLVVAASFPASAAPREPIGMISLVEGNAAVITGGQEREALAGGELYEGDVVTTASGGKVKILFRDDSLVTVSAETRIEIATYMVDPASKTRKTVLAVAKGKVLSLVSRVFTNPASMFEVKTKTAVAGVRGTRFVVEAADEGDRIATLEGSVAVRKVGAAGEVLVAAGACTEQKDGAFTAVAMSDDLKARITGDLQKIDKTPSYAMNLGTMSSRDLIGGAEASDEAGFGSRANGRTGAAVRGAGGASGGDGAPAAEAGHGDKGGATTYGDPSAGKEAGTTDMGGGVGGTGSTPCSGGTCNGGQTGTLGMTHVTVTIAIPTTPRMLKKR